MKRVFHIALGTVSTIVLTVVVIPLVLSIMLSNVRVQNWAVDYVSNKISNKIGTRFLVDHIAIRLFNQVELNGVYVEDYNKDT